MLRLQKDIRDPSANEVNLPKHHASFAPSPKQHAGAENTSSTASSSSADSPHSANQSTPETSDDGADSGDGTDSQDDLGSNGGGAGSPGKDVTLDIIPPSTLTGYVLFAVQGSRRLQKARTRLAQINIEDFNSDDKFFDEMRLQFRRLRGSIRSIFSLWKFYTCEFVIVSPSLSTDSYLPHPRVWHPKRLPCLLKGQRFKTVPQSHP